MADFYSEKILVLTPQRKPLYDKVPAHPGAFQRLLVRTSIPCYRDFILDMCRSLGFASTPSDYTASSASLSLRMLVS